MKKEELIKILKKSYDNGAPNLRAGCFLDGFIDDKCDLERCRSKDYNTRTDKGECCPFYEGHYGCKPIIDSLLNSTSQTF